MHAMVRRPFEAPRRLGHGGRRRFLAAANRGRVAGRAAGSARPVDGRPAGHGSDQVGAPAGAAETRNLGSGPTLTNGLGVGDELARHGVTVNADLTQFLQWQPAGERLAVPPGVPVQQTRAATTYGGKGDVFVSVDGGKAGLWEGLSIDAHAELRFGQAGILRGGALFPTEAALIAPAESGTVLTLSNLTATQVLGRATSITVGRINMIDLAGADPFTGGRGVESFSNTVFVAPPLDSDVTPIVTIGGYLKTAFGPMDATSLLVGAFDTHGSPVQSGLNSPFRNGTSFLANLTQGQRLFSPIGFVSISADYSTAVNSPLADTERLFLPQLPPTKPNRRAAFTTTLAFGQYLADMPHSAAQGWGLFGSIGVSDGDPSPISVLGRFGVSGASPIASRPLDRFGIAYFYGGISRALADAARPLLHLRNEQGIEAFYNCAVTPWLGVTPDAQVIRPFLAGHSVDLFLGVRTRVVL